MASDGDHPYCLGAAKIVRYGLKAIRVVAEDAGPLWVPRSVIHDETDMPHGEVPGEVIPELYVKQWWAEDRGYI